MLTAYTPRRTSVAEMVPWKELQPRAFSIMPLVWNVGSIFGPTLGGALANPLGITPGEPLPSNPSFFERFPYALPNLVSAVIFAFGICTGFLFLEETLEVKRNQRDYGLILGDRIKVVAKMCVWKTKRFFTRKSDDQVEEHEPLLKSTQSVGSATLDEETGQSTTTPKETPPPPSLKEVLHYQTVMNLIVYTLLALHNMTFDQLIPIFMHYPEQDRSSHNPDFKPPFKFSSGFGLNSGRIGFLFTLYGVWCMLVQFFLFPPIARRFGVLPCMRVCAVIMPLTYIVTPFTSLIRDPNTQQAAIFLCMITKGVCTTFAFPCSTILLTNSAASLRILGTLNGLATLFGAVGRAIGPAIGGAVFTLGVQNGFIIAPFWILAAIGAIAAVPTFYLEEGEGFGGSNDDVEDSDDEIESPNKSQAREIVGEEAEEEGYGGVGPLLSRTNTASSRAMSMDYEGDYAYEDASRREVEGQSSGPLRRKTSRQMSTPIGMKKPIGPKFSSSLGQSFGSAGSYGV